MSKIVEVYQPGEIIWTMAGGVLRAFRVQDDGTLMDMDSLEALQAE